MVRRCLRVESLESRDVPSGTNVVDVKPVIDTADSSVNSEPTAAVGSEDAASANPIVDDVPVMTMTSTNEEDPVVTTTAFDDAAPIVTPPTETIIMVPTAVPTAPFAAVPEVVVSEVAVPDTTIPPAAPANTSAFPPVVFGEGNFDPLPVGANFVIVSGLRSGEAKLYGFDPEGNLIDTGKSYQPFTGQPSRLTSVRGAVGDVNGDGVADLAFVNTGGTTTNLRVVDGKSGGDLVTTRSVFGDFFARGANVTLADLDGDDKAEIVVTPDSGGGPRVRVFSVNANGTIRTRADFYGLDDVNDRGGLSTTAGDLNGDGINELIVAANGADGGTRMAVFNLSKLSTASPPSRMIADFFATRDDASFGSAISVSTGDLNGDGFADLVVGAGTGGAPRVTAIDGKQLLTDAAAATAAPIASFFAYDNRGRNGVRVTVKDADGDGNADIIAGTGEGAATEMRGFRGQGVMESPTGVAAATYLDPFVSVKNTGRAAAGVNVG